MDWEKFLNDALAKASALAPNFGSDFAQNYLTRMRDKYIATVRPAVPPPPVPVLPSQPARLPPPEEPLWPKIAPFVYIGGGLLALVAIVPMLTRGRR